MKKPAVFVGHMLDSIEKIESFLNDISEDQFFKDELRKSAVMRELEIIGEAVKNLKVDFRRKYPSVDWRSIAGLRDKLIHNYFGINIDRVWKVVKEDLPKLKKDILDILKEE